MKREKHEKNSDIRFFSSVKFRLYAHHTDIIWSMSIFIYYLYVIRHDTADLQILAVFFPWNISKIFIALTSIVAIINQ